MILFPVNSDKPELVWFDPNDIPAAKSFLGTGSPVGNVTPDYDGILDRELGMSFHILYREHFLNNGSENNKSIAKICATTVKWWYPYRGPHIVFGANVDSQVGSGDDTDDGAGAISVDGSEECLKEGSDNRDLDMNDFAHIANFYITHEQSQSVKQQLKRVEISGVRINCIGDQRMLEKPVFEKVKISSIHPIFTRHDSSDIADRDGLAIYTQRLPFDPKWKNDRRNAIFNKDPCGNVPATHLHICLDPEAEMEPNGQLGWGMPPRQWQVDVGSVLVVRQDKKPLSTFDIEALCKYCQCEAYPLFEHNTGEWAEQEPLFNEDLLNMICQPAFAIKWRHWQDGKPKDSADADAPYPFTL